MPPFAPLRIRPAQPTDQAVVYELLCDLEATTLDQPAFERVFQQNLADGRISYYVADVLENVVAFGSCHVQQLLHHTGPVAEIQELYVRPAFRNQQIGEQVVDALVGAARQAGCSQIEVTTNRQRTDTLRFYERLAFQPTHHKLVRMV